MSFLSLMVDLFAIVHLVHKLLFDTMGEEYFPENSSFSWFPMTLPTAMEGFVMLQNNNNIVNNLVFNRPNAPN